MVGNSDLLDGLFALLAGLHRLQPDDLRDDAGSAKEALRKAASEREDLARPKRREPVVGNDR
jgi:hypothetical protein